MSARGGDKAIDLCGMNCPFVLAEVERALSAGASGVEVLCDHPTTINESVPAYCRSHGYRLTVTPQIYPLDSQVYRLRIEK